MNLENMAYEICPIDGRYQDIKELVAPYFSEYAYIKYRVLVEVKWLVYLIREGVIEFKVSNKYSCKIKFLQLFVHF